MHRNAEFNLNSDSTVKILFGSLQAKLWKNALWASAFFLLCSLPPSLRMRNDACEPLFFQVTMVTETQSSCPGDSFPFIASQSFISHRCTPISSLEAKGRKTLLVFGLEEREIFQFVHRRNAYHIGLISRNYGEKMLNWYTLKNIIIKNKRC